MNPVFQLERVTKSFGRQVALHDVSLTASPGSVVALLGENGAGKTTMLRILLGLLLPDSGKATVLGLESRRHGEEIRRRVGYVPDKPVLYEWMTVAEIGWFVAGFFGGNFQRRYDELIAGFGLEKEKRLKTLSKGTLAKVSLSLSMAHDPELLVLDEPTSGLDPLVRREFLESMVDVAAAGRTVLLSSHQISEVERVADVICILHQGKLVLVERLEDLKSRIAELTVTTTNGALPVSELPGTVIRHDSKSGQMRALVRDVDEQGLDAFRIKPGIRHLEVRTPSLEEIFIGYMRGESSAPDAKPDPKGERS